MDRLAAEACQRMGSSSPQNVSNMVAPSTVFKHLHQLGFSVNRNAHSVREKSVRRTDECMEWQCIVYVASACLHVMYYDTAQQGT